MPPRSLGAFLTAARAALTAPASQRPKPLTIVVGNESADLDSLCSAILLAYFRSHTPPHSATLHVPLCNLDRQDLVLRPELQAALSGSRPKPNNNASAQGVPLDSLITLTELPDDLAANGTRWLLVDHNALTGSLAKRFQKRVVGCIDHHVDEGVVPQPGEDSGAADDKAVPHIIETCGSCASLVVDYAKEAWRQLAEQEPDEATDRILAHLALAPILIDTTNLKSLNKTADVDRRAAAVAESVLGVTSSKEGADPGFYSTYNNNNDDDNNNNTGYDRTAFFDELSRLKTDLSTFSYGDILRKDYKEWRETTRDNTTDLTAGFSSVAQGMGYLLKTIGDREALLEGLRTHARGRGIDLAAVMTVQHDEGGFARQLLLWAFTEKAAAAAKAFVTTNRESLDLKPWGDGQLDSTSDGGEWRTCWTHGTKFSRKQVAPLVRDAMKSV
ncbi:Exopolyphosphatase [Sporothrix curviconia]|uniref:Exopolyphosphatase n=1 Tax=Sporothrix curviconia TaxID=1260050 RepID=A0ABP0AWT9_9PEZI